MTRPARSTRPRARTERRPATSTATPATPAPASTPPAEATAHTSTRITTTDYGYVVGELRRLAILSIAIIALLLVIWVVVG